MAIDLSGMFKNLGGATDLLGASTIGPAVPTDPMQQNAMQRAGVTNPMLQMFGQGLGGALGRDMRSKQEIGGELAAESLGGSYEEIMASAKKLMDLGMVDQATKLIQIAENKKSSTMSKMQSDSDTVYVDSEGNYFYGSVTFDPTTGERSSSLLSADPNNPNKKPVGKLERIQTADIFSRAGAAGIAQENKDYAKARTNAINTYEETIDLRNSLQELRDNLPSFTSENVLERGANWFKTKIGEQPKDMAGANIIMGRYILKQLKPLFGGVISENEREMLLAQQNAINKNPETAGAMLDQLIKDAEAYIRKAERYRSNATLDAYNASFNTPTPKTVNWSDIK